MPCPCPPTSPTRSTHHHAPHHHHHTHVHVRRACVLQVDVLVSEPMGTLLVNERMIESYIYARDAHLKPGGKMFPVRPCHVLACPLPHARGLPRLPAGCSCGHS